jgi:hypothetical protein
MSCWNGCAARRRAEIRVGARLWLAEHGYIEPGEMRMIAEQSVVAKERIGTVAEVATDAAGAAFFKRIKRVRA